MASSSHIPIGNITYVSRMQKNIKENLATEKPTVALAMSSGLPPTVSNDMLVFTSIDHYESYQAHLLSMIENNTNDTLNEDDVLLDIETSLGFTSLRKISLDQFEILNLTGWLTKDEIPQEHWITSKILRSTLGKDRKVQIGDRINFHFNQEYLITVDANRTGLISALSALPENTPIEEILDLDPSRQFMDVVSIRSNERHLVLRGPGGTPTPLGEWNLNANVYAGNPCTNPLTVYISGATLYNSAISAPVKGEYKIEWGTSAVLTINSSIGTNQSILENRSYQFSTPGTYTIRVSVKALSPISSSSYVVVKTFSVTVEDKQCSDFTKLQTTDYPFTSALPGSFLRGHIKYEAWYNSFKRSDFCKILAYTECYMNLGGKYYRVKSKDIHLCTGVQSMIRERNCESTGNLLIKYNCSPNTYTRYSESDNRTRFHWKNVTAIHEANVLGTPIYISQNMPANCQ